MFNMKVTCKLFEILQQTYQRPKIKRAQYKNPGTPLLLCWRWQQGQAGNSGNYVDTLGCTQGASIDFYRVISHVPQTGLSTNESNAFV